MISFRLGTDEEGNTLIAVIEGGRHFGGVLMGRMNCGSGGVDIQRAALIQDFITSSVLMHFGGIQQPLL